MLKLFLNTERHLRAGWRIFFVFLASIMLFMIVNSFLSFKLNSKFLFDQHGIIQLFRIPNLFFIIVVCFVVRKLERRSLSAIGLTKPAGHFVQMLNGFVIGAAAITAAVTFLWLFGNVTIIHGFSYSSFSEIDLFRILSLAVLPGIGEELLFRGYFTNILSSSIGKAGAVVVTSVLFALLHLGNASINFIAILNLIGFSIIASMMTFKTGSIWMAVFFHASWNFFQGIVFSVPVSGSNVTGAFEIKLTGNELLTGGGFGLEGGLIITFIIAIFIMFFTNLLVKQEKLEMNI